MGRRGSVKAIGSGLFLKRGDIFHNGITFRRDSPEHLQETAGVHGVRCLDLKGICAIGDIGHSLDSLGPHPVHSFLQGRNLVLHGGSVPELIDLVYKARHARSLAEKALHVGEFNVAVGVYKAGADNTILHRALSMTHGQYGTVLGHIYVAVLYGLTCKGINCAGRVSHSESI